MGDQGYGILGRIPHRGSPLLIMLFDGVHVVSMTSTGDVNLDHLFKIMSVTSLLFKDSFFFFFLFTVLWKQVTNLVLRLKEWVLFFFFVSYS